MEQPELPDYESSSLNDEKSVDKLFYNHEDNLSYEEFSKVSKLFMFKVNSF